MFRRSHLSILLVIFFSLAWLATAQSRRERSKQQQQALQQEERENYYKKWLEEDVRYVITEEEKKVFQTLSTPEEKEQFIEQFWYRRDADLSTAINEFKEEHYRRIAYANERFASGMPGWMTDRGRIYIIHGKPDEIQAHPAGGPYTRPMHEGGGTTATFPFEVWRYRHLEGIGSDIELEFVDPTFSGEYRLALRPEEKDALLHVPGGGPTLAEELGIANKEDRPYFSPGMRDYPFQFTRAKDQPFQRYETYVMVQRPREIKYKDLREIVNINISYSNLPFKIREDYVRLNEEQVLVPISLEFNNKDLTFKEELGIHSAKIAIYGVITSITNRIIKEFEDDVITSYQPQYLQQGLMGRSIYQKIVPLDKKMRYKLDLVVKDVNSGHVGVIRRAIIPPSYGENKLALSSLILSDFIRQLGEIPKEDEMFVLGDVWVRPSLSKVFPANGNLGVYLQVYNTGIDQTTLAPSLRVNYRVMKDDRPVLDVVDESGESIQFFSGQRVVLIKGLPVAGLEPGKYRVEIEIQDRIADQSITAQEEFQLTAPTQVAQAR